VEAPVRFRSLDAWRGVCALCVAVLHLNTTGIFATGARTYHASRLVDFFFVLSGFVIAHAYRDSLARGQVGTFLLRRVGRLWPLHIAILGLLVAMALAGSRLGLHVQGWDYSALPANLTLTHSWGFYDQLTWNGPSWSISTEILAYLLYALMAWRIRGRALDAAAAIVMAAAVFMLVAIAPKGMDSAQHFGAVRCLFGFMAGTLANSLWRGGLRLRGELPALLAAIAAAAWLPDAAAILIVPVFAWTILVFASDAGRISRALGHRFPQMLGRVSYSIYMVHYAIDVGLMTILLLATPLVREVNGVATVVAPTWLADAISLFYLAVVVLVANLTYAAIEKPGRQLFHRRGEAVPAAW
jgi:peptidoglycan/LPS O-acetylase OafA/YrhL